MAQLLPETEATEFEGRYYINPQTTVDETNAFIDNYRNLQQTNTAKIAADTHNLGTDVPSNIGGLSGSGSYWENRYQTPQTSSAVADLRATAQAAALNTALENEKEAWTKRYNDAYRDYQKRASSSGSGGGGGGDGSTDPTNPTGEGKVDTNPDTSEQGSGGGAEYEEYDHSSFGDFIQGKGEETISYTKDGRTYYANVYRTTGISGDRGLKVETSEGTTYNGQGALDYLNQIVSGGGKVYNSNGEEVSPYRALTGDAGRY